MAPPLPTRRARQPHPPSRRISLLPLLSIASLLLLLASLQACSVVLRRANSLGRRCMPEVMEYSGNVSDARTSVRIAIVSLSEKGREEESRWIGRRRLQRRSFQGMMEIVGGNKREYAGKMGYDFIDGRDLVDPSRPPSWSKIPAVRSHLPNYDWVFWNDADTVVTNPEISLESILEAAIGHSDFHASPDLVLTEDANGVNAGVFFVRRSKWSKDFLDTWWNQTSFVQFGSTRSGDNAALKYLIDGLSPQEMRDHVRISPMQCLFNSYPWLPTWKSTYRLISSPQAVWKGTYSKGDFMVHLAGFDKKKEWAAEIIREMKDDQREYV